MQIHDDTPHFQRSQSSNNCTAPGNMKPNVAWTQMTRPSGVLEQIRARALWERPIKIFELRRVKHESF